MMIIWKKLHIFMQLVNSFFLGIMLLKKAQRSAELHTAVSHHVCLD